MVSMADQGYEKRRHLIRMLNFVILLTVHFHNAARNIMLWKHKGKVFDLDCFSGHKIKT
jgi:hypothetical protein